MGVRQKPMRIVAMAAAMLGVPAMCGAQTAQPAASAPLDRTAIDQYVRAVAEPMRTGQLARWNSAICSGIAGLKADQAEFVNGRISEIARQMGLPMGQEGCAPSILIYFSQNPDALALDFDKKLHTTLTHDGAAQLASFLRPGEPARWVSRLGLMSFDGTPIIRNEMGGPSAGRMSNSLIEMSTSTVLTSIMIIVDAKKIGGMSLASLSDYLAMVALARPKSGTQPPQDSILSLFGAHPVTALTDYDRSYLRALYRMPLNQAASAQISTIKNTMAVPANGAANEPSSSN